MARYLISVGGSGQHVALTVSRLVMMGALRDDIHLIAIDPDSKTKLTEELEAPGGRRDPHPLWSGKVFPPFDPNKFSDKTFEQIFVDVDHPAERELFEAMFDPNMTEIPVHKGMFGTPCVGATVFGEGVRGDTLAGILKPLANATRVFVTGSVVGGTGAGIIHKLVNQVRSVPYEKEIHGLFLLPWFRIASQGGKNTITDAVITRNASHGIKYFYEQTIGALTSSLFVGSNPGLGAGRVTTDVVVGDGQLREQPSFVHVAAARGFVDLPDASTTQRDVKAFGVAHNTDKEDWLLTLPWEKKANLRELIRAQRILLVLANHILQDKEKIHDFYHSNFISRKFNQASDAWSVLHQSIIDNQPNTKQQGPFADTVIGGFEEIRNEARFCVDWAEAIFKDEVLSREGGDPSLNEIRMKTTPLWEVIQKMWSTSGPPLLGDAETKPGPLPMNPNNPNTGGSVARHHAKQILAAALSQR